MDVKRFKQNQKLTLFRLRPMSVKFSIKIGWADTHLHQYLLLLKGATSLYDKTDINIYTANSFEDLEFFEENKPFLIDAATTIKDSLELPYNLW